MGAGEPFHWPAEQGLACRASIGASSEGCVRVLCMVVGLTGTGTEAQPGQPSRGGDPTLSQGQRSRCSRSFQQGDLLHIRHSLTRCSSASACQWKKTPQTYSIHVTFTLGGKLSLPETPSVSGVTAAHWHLPSPGSRPLSELRQQAPPFGESIAARRLSHSSGSTSLPIVFCRHQGEARGLIVKTTSFDVNHGLQQITCSPQVAIM